MPAATPPTDESHMRRAIRLAMNGRGFVEPNPMVGCVIVRDETVLGEGHHEKFGGPHAEPNALSAVRAAGQSPEGATAYVTLEPCCHTDKQTPPCVPALIDAKLARVVVGCPDPNPQVAGRGVEQLRRAGVAVDMDVCRDECGQLIAPFYANTVLRRPYVTLKWAESADGKVAGAAGARRQISDGPATRAVQELRARCDAILVGVNTVLNDDPMLVARDVPSARPLVRYVLDRNLRIPLASRLVATARHVPLVVGCGVPALSEHSSRIKELERLGANVHPCPFIARAFVDMMTRRVTHLLAEPGPTLARAFFEDSPGLVDRVWLIKSTRAMNERGALDAPRVPAEYVISGQATIGADRLTEFLNPHGGAFFSTQASADFVRLRPSSDD